MATDRDWVTPEAVNGSFPCVGMTLIALKQLTDPVADLSVPELMDVYGASVLARYSQDAQTFTIVDPDGNKVLPTDLNADLWPVERKAFSAAVLWDQAASLLGAAEPELTDEEQLHLAKMLAGVDLALQVAGSHRKLRTNSVANEVDPAGVNAALDNADAAVHEIIDSLATDWDGIKEARARGKAVIKAQAEHRLLEADKKATRAKQVAAQTAINRANAITRQARNLAPGSD